MTQAPRAGRSRPRYALDEAVDAAQGGAGGEVRRDASSSRSTSASTRGTPTRRCAARSCCRTAPARRCASSSSPRARRRRRREEAGADFVGADDLVKKIQDESWLDFDRVIATPDMMGVVGRLGKSPRPARPDAEPEARHGHDRRRARPCAELKAGKVEYRVDKAGIVHVPIGKVSFGAEKLLGQRARADRRDRAGQARGGEGQLPPDDRGLDHDGPGRPDRPGVRSRAGGGVRSETC